MSNHVTIRFDPSDRRMLAAIHALLDELEGQLDDVDGNKADATVLSMVPAAPAEEPR